MRLKDLQKSLGPIGLIVCVLVLSFIIILGLLVYKSHKPKTVKEAADAYLISKVGSENFRKLYSFDEPRTSYANPLDSQYDFVAYHFSPYKSINSADDVVMIQVNRNDFSEIHSDSIPDCIKDKSFCSFSVDKNRALSIAKSNGFNPTDTHLETYTFTGSEQHAKSRGLAFVVVVSSCVQNKTLYIDYRNGEVIASEPNCGQAIDL